MRPYGQKEASNICQCCYCGRDEKKEISKKRARREGKKELKNELQLQNPNGRRKA